jgi:hypothetical protein
MSSFCTPFWNEMRPVGDVHLGKVDQLRPAFDGETALAHGREMGAARHEMNVGTALDQPGAKIAADAPRAHDRNAQAALL